MTPPEPPEDVWEQAWTHPVVIVVLVMLIVVVLLSAMSEKVQKLLGPIGRWIGERQERALARQRRVLVAQAKLDTTVEEELRRDIADLKRQIQDQRGWYMTELEALKTRHAREIEQIRAEHARLIEQIRAEHTEEIQRLVARYEGKSR